MFHRFSSQPHLLPHRPLQVRTKVASSFATVLSSTTARILYACPLPRSSIRLPHPVHRTEQLATPPPNLYRVGHQVRSGRVSWAYRALGLVGHVAVASTRRVVSLPRASKDGSPPPPPKEDAICLHYEPETRARRDDPWASFLFVGGMLNRFFYI